MGRKGTQGHGGGGDTKVLGQTENGIQESPDYISSLLKEPVKQALLGAPNITLKF